MTTLTPPTPLSTPRTFLAGALVAPLAFGLAFAGTTFFAVFPPVLIVSGVGALAAVAALLVRKRWMVIVGGVVALLVLAMGATDPTPGAFWRPSLGLQMSWGHAARFAGIVGIVAAVIEFRAARPSAQSPGRVARSLPIVAALAAGLALGIGGTTSAALVDPGFQTGGTVVTIEPDATVRMIEKDDLFSNVAGTPAPGALVRFAIDNQDDHIHSFTTTSGPTIDVDTLSSKTTEILARAPASAGEWTFFCKYHPEMKSVVRVA